MREIFTEIWESIRRNKLRTCLTGLAVSWGIFMLIVLLGAGNGVVNAFMGGLGDVSSNIMEVGAGYTGKPYNGLQEGRRMKLTDKDVQLTAGETFSEYIDEVIPYLSQSGLTMTYGKKHFSVNVIGTSPKYAELSKMTIYAGRFINRNDDDARRKVVVITDAQARNFLMGERDYESMIGQNLKIGNLQYRIVGVRHGLENQGDNSVYMPYNTLKDIFAKSDEIDELIFTFNGLQTEEENEFFEKQYKAMLNQAHGAAPDDESSFWIWNQFTMNMQMNKGRNILSTALWILGLFTLLGGIVGVSNIMLITVKERTHEFGIRKAIGASPWAITKLIIAESVTITAIFGYVGMVLGMFACKILDSTVGSSAFDLFGEKIQIMVNPTVGLGTAVGVTIVLIVAGTIAGLFPARNAAKVRPIEALNAAE